MKKLAVLALGLMVVLNQSQAKMTPVEKAFVSHKLFVLRTQTQTKNVLALVTTRAQRRLLTINHVIDDQEDGPPGPEELDLQGMYGRPRLVNQPDVDALSDHVQLRLLIARTRAMEKYREHWA